MSRAKKHFRIIPNSILKLGIMTNIEIIKTTCEKKLLQRFAEELMNSFEMRIKEIISNRRIMVIKKMVWRYDFFNISFLFNALSLILYSLYKGCLPVIEINKGSNDYLNWNWYFEQPSDVLVSKFGGEL